MLQFTVYDLASGHLLRAMEMPDMASAMLNIDSATEGTLPGWYPPDQFCRTTDGGIMEIPPRPNEWARFDHAACEWVGAAPAVSIDDRRSEAVLPKLTFCSAMMAAGFLTPAEAAAAARGEVPASFAPVMDMLPPMEADLARLTWAGVSRVKRTDPFLQAVAVAAGITDDTLDQIFGLA